MLGAWEVIAKQTVTPVPGNINLIVDYLGPQGTIIEFTLSNTVAITYVNTVQDERVSTHTTTGWYGWSADTTQLALWTRVGISVGMDRYTASLSGDELTLVDNRSQITTLRYRPPFDPCQSPSHVRVMSELYSEGVRQAVADAGATFQSVYSTKAAGSYNFDQYSIIINAMPPGLTPAEFLAELVRNPNAAIHSAEFDQWAEFHPRRTHGAVQLGDIYDIDIAGPDNGSVVLSDLTSSYWRFSVIDTPVYGEHPLYGSREFGFEPNPDGSIRFYLRGVSRPDNIPLYQTADEILRNKAWKALLNGIAAELDRRCNGIAGCGARSGSYRQREDFFDPPPICGSPGS